MKALLFSAICFSLAGCASGNGGGWVVGNGMMDQDASYRMEKAEDIGSSRGCDCNTGSDQCDCSKNAPKKKGAPPKKDAPNAP